MITTSIGQHVQHRHVVTRPNYGIFRHEFVEFCHSRMHTEIIEIFCSTFSVEVDDNPMFSTFRQRIGVANVQRRSRRTDRQFVRSENSSEGRSSSFVARQYRIKIGDSQLFFRRQSRKIRSYFCRFPTRFEIRRTL